MALFNQDNRHITIATPLGRDVLLVESVTGSEGISRLFNLQLSLVSENQAISFTDIIGKGVTLTLDLPSSGKRFFNGIVSRFVQKSGSGTTGDDTLVSRYQATVVPWLWLLSRSADSRIFQNMSVPEIVEKVFVDHGFSDFQPKLQGSYRKREYCVQYRETHFNFVSRLLEEEGIHYFFEHGNGKHKMIMADAPQANLPCPGQKTASYQVDPQDEDVVTSLEQVQEIRAGKYALNDFNFQIPNASLDVEVPSKHQIGPGNREIYDYPGEYGRKAEGDAVARIRMEEEEAQITTMIGTSTCRAFASGYRFTLNNFYRRERSGRDFVIVSVEHDANQDVREGGYFDYSNGFTCIPAEVPYRPLRVTPKPCVQGVQTAIVVGPQGEEIYCDEHGRVKVQFHWDRQGRNDDNSSCWVRVSQLWAGAGWGAMFIPRIGHEVIVDFLEGDPDRPIITGRVHHGLNMPHYHLPAEKTKSTIKSNSTPGGGGSNELRFEDKKGHEEIYLHGERDLQIVVRHDKDQKVGNDEHLQVVNDRSLSVGADQTERVEGNNSMEVGGNFNISVSRDSESTVGGAMSIRVSKRLSLVGDEIVVTAVNRVSLVCGPSTIVLDSSGIAIKGPGGEANY